MRKKILITGLLLGLLSLSFVGCSSYNEVKKYEAVGVVKDAYSRWHGVAGKGGGRRYYTLIEYEGEIYKLSGYSTYSWARELVGNEVSLNVDEYLKDGEPVNKNINIDYYKN